MAKNYLIVISNEITIIRFLKQPSSDEIRSAIDDVSENHPDKLRLWDLRKGMDLTNTELRQLAESGKTKFMFPSKVAIVAPKDLAYGLSRIYEVYRKQEQTETRVFRTEKEALEWLKTSKI